MIVWPELGHIASPLALAKELRARGDRVIFAGLDLIRDSIVRHGFEFRVLAPLRRSARGLPTSILWSWAGEVPLATAFEELSGRLGALLDEARPQLVLIDSLYSLLGGLIEGRASWAIYETDLPAKPIPWCRRLTAAPFQSRRLRLEECYEPRGLNFFARPRAGAQRPLRNGEVGACRRGYRINSAG